MIFILEQELSEFMTILGKSSLFLHLVKVMSLFLTR